MSYTIRVSLPNYNALTDSNPDHYALYSDENWILIKEFTRGSVSATTNGQAVSHGLGYVPTVFAFYNDNGIWKEVTGQQFKTLDSSQRYPCIFVSSIGVFFFGIDPSTPTNFKYFICYDQQI